MVKEDPILCIITHPYSLWGGSMHNNVVVGVRNQLVKGAYPCITFNFRGVGKSTGSMENGIAEQEDLIAVCNYAHNNLNYSQIFIVGYSYGGLISLSTAKKIDRIVGMALISYPTGFVKQLMPDFELKFPILFIHGEHDNLIPISRVKNMLPNFLCKTKFESISTDHFYNGKEKQVGTIIKEYIDKLKIG